jgi:hypothetical protein
MLRVIVRMGLLLTIPLIFSTCYKFDWDFDGSHGKKDCQVQSYYLTPWGDELPFPFLFEKKFNHAGQVTEINCSFNNILPAEELIHFNLRVAYHGSQVYLINKESPYDTTLKVFLNAQGRVRESIGTSDFIFRNKYYYNGNRLRAVEAFTSFFTRRDTCEYDAHGNILSITDQDIFMGERDGYFFQYDYSKKVKNQFYFDEIRDLNNDFALLQYLGCFPELEPVHLRTHTRLGLETTAATYDKDLINHTFDAKGKLTGYDVVSFFGGSPSLFYKAKLSWKCK